MTAEDNTRGDFSQDPSATIIRPSPGRRAGSPSLRPMPQRQGPQPPAPPIAVTGHGSHTLVQSATALLVLVTQIRNTVSYPDITGLRQHFIAELARFEQVSQHPQTAPLSNDARYALCTFIDEAVLNTPWGSESQWQEQSLLSTFFNETWGGDRFFAILDQAKQQPARCLPLLELLFVCLMLGFEGKYRVLDRGRSRLDEIQDDLSSIIRRQQGDSDRELAPNWRGVTSEAGHLSGFMPLWVLAMVAAALLLSMYLAFRLALSDASYPVFDTLSRLGRDRLAMPAMELTTAVAAEPPPAPQVSKLQLHDILKPEIELNLLTVEQDGLKSKIRINADSLFRSGSAHVEKRFVPIFERIGKALDQVEGRIWVIGHSDNVPIHTLQFPSNWELSRARAVNVMQALAQHLSDPKRMTPEGRADTEPVAPNDSPENRARNRRVEIILFEQETLT